MTCGNGEHAQESNACCDGGHEQEMASRLVISFPTKVVLVIGSYQNTPKKFRRTIFFLVWKLHQNTRVINILLYGFYIFIAQVDLLIAFL
jgi:hypothetical protein